MVEIGQMVQFVPNWDENIFYSAKERQAHTVTGKVVYINTKHRYFTAEYGKHRQKESFNFSQIGEKVTVCG